MRMDDGLADQKLSLDMTPLIDVVFLLVLFFAISTSFISGEDLQRLKTDVLSLGATTEQLTSELDNKLTALDDLQIRLDETEAQKKSQLENSNRELAALQSQFNQQQSEAERLAQQEQLLQSLLAERQLEFEQLQTEQDKLGGENASLSEQLAALTASLSTQETALTASRQSLDDTAAREVLLQKLLAEKAAALSGLQVQLVSANAARELTETQREEDARDAQANREQLLNEARAAQTKILQLTAELEKFRDIADLDREQIQQALRAQQQLNTDMSGYVSDNSLEIVRDQQKLTLKLSDKILFASGSPEIKSQGLQVLRDLGNILNDRVDGLEIQIGGHTDSVPVGGASGPLADNWGLSSARAVNVVRFFERELGVGPERMAAVGYGPHRPVADNTTAEGRAQNRRIEIVLFPR